MRSLKCYVLTGISKNVIESLARRAVRSIELRSAHNVSTALKAEIGDCVLLTPAKLCDLGKGVGGMIAEVKGKEVMSHSVFFAAESYFEESEIVTVRLILKPRGVGRIVNVKNADILDASVADVVEVSYFDAG